jgi:spore germination cell wall hydrolase CwlJ-like protein
MCLAVALPGAPAVADDRPQVTAADHRCLAEAVYFEARGEPEVGQQAVAAVVLNRTRDPSFPATICGVVHQRGPKGCQFSWYCRPQWQPLDPKAWTKARDIADRMILKERDVTGGALFFHARSVAPSWRYELQQVGEIGGHIYYR